MVIFTMAIGRTIRLMASGNILIQMEHNMRAIGWTISNMDKEKNTGLMVLNMKALINTERKMALDNFYGLINLLIAELSLTTTFMDMASTDGQTTESTQVIGSTTKCTVQVFSLGLMAENTRVNTLTTRSKDTVCSHGQMEDNMMGTG